jgi:hypothetical protein
MKNGGTHQELFAINNPAEMRVQRMQIAGRWLIVVDGVYKDPDAVRRFALDQQYGPGGGVYPGRFARVPFATDSLLALAHELLPSPHGGRLVSHPDYRGLTAFAIPTVKGRDLSRVQQQPHADGFCDYAAVVYLSRPEDCVGGTSFWRHRRARLAYAPANGDPLTIKAIRRYGSGSPIQLLRAMMHEALAEPIRGYIMESNRIWVRLRVVAMRLNRLVLYDANLFHAIHPPRSNWVPDLEHPRLSQNLYVKLAEPTACSNT